jgi:hypothetical protein
VRPSRTARAAVCAAALAGCDHAAPPAPASWRASPAIAAGKSDALGHASGTVFVGCGFLFVWNEGKVPFSALMRASDAKQVPVESVVVTAADVGVPAARGPALLEAYQRWESDYTSKQNGWPPLRISNTSALNLRPLADIPVVAWELEVPRDLELLGQKVERVGYLSAAIDDVVFTLAVPLSAGQDINVAVAKAASAMQTIKRLPRPLDLVEVSTAVKRNPGRWPDCDR